MLKSKTSQAVWTINGYLLLILLLSGLFTLGSDLFDRMQEKQTLFEREAIVGEAAQIVQKR